MAHLRLSLLGPLRITLDGRAVVGPKSTKVGGLLAYLAVEAGRMHHRDSLAGLLWPDRPNAAARANLRYTLSDLRTAIGDRGQEPPFLLINPAFIQFNQDSDHWLDVTIFETLLSGQGRSGDQAEIERLQAAVALYQGSFLEGFSADSVLFDEWALLRRERFTRKVVAALCRLAALHERRGAYAQAVEDARRALELEPWREEIQRCLMRLLALDGQRSAALAQYEACRRHLETELGVEPEPATTALYRRIRDGALAPQARDGGGQGDGMRPAFSPLERPARFVGQAVELGSLDSFLEAALNGRVGRGGIRGAAEGGQDALEKAFSEQDGEIGPRLLALFLLADLYRGQARYPESIATGKRLLKLADQVQESLYRGLAHWMIGQGLFFHGALIGARAHLERALALYDPLATQSLAYLTGADMGVTCRAMLAYDLWGLGHPDQALYHAQKALALARTLEYPEPLGLALAVAGSGFHLLRREDEQARERIEELLRLAEERELPYLGAWGNIHRGWWQVRRGWVEEGIARIQEGIAMWQAMGMETVRPHHLAVLAGAHRLAGRVQAGLRLLDQAALLAERTGGHYYDLEIAWRRGLLWQAQDPAVAEGHFRRAIALSQQQGARSWELRAALSLGRLWQRQGRRDEARQLLAGIYHWFSEGLDTPDMRDARALLEELGEV